jgi:hypothetical protein
MELPLEKKAKEKKNPTMTVAEEDAQLDHLLWEFEKSKSITHLEAADEMMRRFCRSRGARYVEIPKSRKLQTALWLKLFKVIDQNIDPKFDYHKDAALASIYPPRSNGVQLGAGVDPKEIKDMAARAQYEAAIKHNEEKRKSYRLQVDLRILDGSVCLGFEHYLKTAYGSTIEDQNELDGILRESGLRDARQQKLRTLFAKKQPK